MQSEQVLPEQDRQLLSVQDWQRPLTISRPVFVPQLVQVVMSLASHVAQLGAHPMHRPPEFMVKPWLQRVHPPALQVLQLRAHAWQLEPFQ